MNIWMNFCIFRWHINGSVGCPSDENIRDCYDYFNYAESLIDNYNDKFHIQDCIKNLKYVVDKRIKQIERIYDFKSYAPNKHILETYQMLGIVKGFVIKKLFTIRNNIEHNELEYTDKEYCHDLLDTVWYFLKSTDNLVYQADTENTMYSDLNNESQWVSINVKEPKIIVAYIRGRIPKDLISYENKDGFFRIDEADVFYEDGNLLFIRGKINLTNDIKVLLAKKFFIDRILN